jgi:hypothetical protein
VNVNLKTPTETALSIYSNIIDGKTPAVITALLEIEFSATSQDPAAQVHIVIDNKIMLTKKFSTDITKFEYAIPEPKTVYGILSEKDITEHELRIIVSGRPTGAQLRIHSIRIEGLDMRLTMEDSGTCELDGEPAVPSEYMGQVGYQSLWFTTPIYPWLLANERKDTYYYPH